MSVFDVSGTYSETPVRGEIIHRFWACVKAVGDILRLFALQILQIAHVIGSILGNYTKGQLLSTCWKKTADYYDEGKEANALDQYINVHATFELRLMMYKYKWNLSSSKLSEMELSPI